MTEQIHEPVTEVMPVAPLTTTAEPVESGPQRERMRWLWVAAILLVILGFAGVDRWFYEHISLRLNTENPIDRDFYHMTKMFWAIVRLWPHIVGGMVAYFIIAFYRGWRPANAAFVSVGGIGMLARLLQVAIGRSRPNLAMSDLHFEHPFAAWLHHAGVGFPSGEAATAFAMAVLLSGLFPWARKYFYAAAVLVCLARLLPGMHYVSDVVAGAMLGSLLALPLYRFGYRLLFNLERRLVAGPAHQLKSDR
jgi:membrane-associated phospholipid phosphatase